MLANADTSRSRFWLGALAFAESSFFPIPPDVFLIPITAVARSKWAYYALLTTFWSVVGGLVGYLIGFLFFEWLGQPLISFYSLEDEFLRVEKLFSDNSFLAIWLAAFTPIPYKVFTIAAGFFKINLATFVVASIIGRGMRFFAVAFLMKLSGLTVGNLAYKYFNLATAVLAALVVLLLLFYIF